MSKIIMFGNQKGGVGKSQCSVMVASALSLPPFNLKVALVDVDDQKSVVSARNLDIRAYNDAPTPFDVFDYSVDIMQEKISELDAKYHIVLIDAAGKLDSKIDVTQQEISKSLMYVDYLFLPFVAGNYNLDATLRYLNFVLQLQKARILSNRKLTTSGFVNMYKSRSKKNQFLIQDIDALKSSANLPFMQNFLNDYAAFSDADTFTSLFDPQSNDAAKSNFAPWLNEFAKIIGVIK
jgi:cellulose biosynthesis protein BcsQ